MTGDALNAAFDEALREFHATSPWARHAIADAVGQRLIAVLDAMSYRGLDAVALGLDDLRAPQAHSADGGLAALARRMSRTVLEAMLPGCDDASRIALLHRVLFQIGRWLPPDRQRELARAMTGAGLAEPSTA